MKWYQAQDTFHADLEGGGSRTVLRGATLPETDDVVRQIGEGVLFKLQDTGEDEAPAAKPKASRPVAKGAS